MSKISKQEQNERTQRRVMKAFSQPTDSEFFPEKQIPGYYDNDVYLRVAIYVRVSTDDPRQSTSFELQKAYYEDFVKKHPKWQLVEIYADDGMDDQLKISGFLDMEAPIRKLDQSDAQAVVFLGKIGLGISAQHLQAGKTEAYDGIFLLLDQEDIYAGQTMELPEAYGVRVRFRGTHTESNEQYEKLLDYIREHGLQIDGFSREITLIDYGLTNDPAKFVTEICIPVSKKQL